MKLNPILILCFCVSLTATSPDSTKSSVSSNETTDLFEAIKSGDLKSIETILGIRDVNAPDENGKIPIVFAVDTGHDEVVGLLLKRGAKPNDDTILHAAEKGYGDIVAQLIQNGVNINARSQYYEKSALILAIENGKEDVANFLIEKGADVSTGDITGKTPLTYAINFGMVATIEKLMKNGADANKINKKSLARLSPLHWAAMKGSEAIVKILVKNGAFLNQSDREGKTPLHWSISNRNDGVSNYLINSGASVNATDYGGLTPLHIAASTGAEATAKLLIEKDSNLILAKDNDGRTPADIADNSGFGDWDFLKPNNGFLLYSNTILLVCFVCGALLICFR